MKFIMWLSPSSTFASIGLNTALIVDVLGLLKFIKVDMKKNKDIIKTCLTIKIDDLFDSEMELFWIRLR